MVCILHYVMFNMLYHIYIKHLLYSIDQNEMYIRSICSSIYQNKKPNIPFDFGHDVNELKCSCIAYKSKK